MATKDPRFYMEIARIDEDERMVYGYGTREDVVDSYGTIIDMDSVRKCIPGYAKYANVREMHQPSAVGRADDITVDETGVYLGVKVVDDNAWKKVTERVYKGFSIGGKKDYQEGNRIFMKEITEFSLVDRPSNYGCGIDEYRVHEENINMAKKKVEIERVEEAPEITTKVPDVARYAGEEICDASTALSALSSIMWLMNREQDEADSGVHPEAGEQVAALKAAIENLKKFIISEIKEDNGAATYTPGETTLMELAAGADDDVERKAARHSAADMKHLEGIRDHLDGLGVALCRCADPVEKAAGNDDDIQRLATLESDVTRLAAENSELIQRIKQLEDEPAPSKAILRSFGKGEDILDEAEITRRKADDARIAALPPEQQIIEEVKRAQQRPQVMGFR